MEPMRLLIDACVAGAVVRALRQAGLDVEWVSEWQNDPGDIAIIRYAHETGRVFITRDKDFGALIFRDRQPHCGVLRITGEMRYADQAERVLNAIRNHAEDLERSHIVTVEVDRLRVSRRATQEH